MKRILPQPFSNSTMSLHWLRHKIPQASLLLLEAQTTSAEKEAKNTRGRNEWRKEIKGSARGSTGRILYVSGHVVIDTSHIAEGNLESWKLCSWKDNLALSDRERGLTNTEICHPNTAGPPCSVTLVTPWPMAGWQEVLKDLWHWHTHSDSTTSYRSLVDCDLRG